MELKELKQYIYDNHKIEFVLNEIGCHHVKYHQKGYFTCGNYNGDNIGACVVYDEPMLHVFNYTRKMKKNSDIIDLVVFNMKQIKNNKNFGIYEASKYLHNILNLKFRYISKGINENKYDPLSIFKKVCKYSKHDNCFNDDYELKEINDVDFYKGVIHKSWNNEGITNTTINKFDLGYDYKHKRIVIPLKYWRNGVVLGYNKRTIIDDYEELGIKKYYLTPNYPKNINIYGLYENKEMIELYGYCVIFEAEKSVLRRDSRNDFSCVALQGHHISNEQIAIINGLNIKEVVIAMDKDIDLNEVRGMCERFYLKKRVSYIYDKYDILNQKDSPADGNNKVYDYLFRHRVIYDEKEHNEYLKFRDGDLLLENQKKN